MTSSSPGFLGGLGVIVPGGLGPGVTVLCVVGGLATGGVWPGVVGLTGGLIEGLGTVGLAGGGLGTGFGSVMRS